MNGKFDYSMASSESDEFLEEELRILEEAIDIENKLRQQ